MKIKTLVFAGAVSVMCGAAMAGDDSAALQLAKKTVASKNYVDGTFATKDYTNETFQEKIQALSSGMEQMFGGGGAVIAATDTDGIVAPRLIIPGFMEQDTEVGSAIYEQTNGGEVLSDWLTDISNFEFLVYNMYQDANNGEVLPYDPKYSIPSMEFVMNVGKSLIDKINNSIIPASAIPLGVVLMPSNTAGDPDYRFIIPGLDMFLDGTSQPRLNVRTWSLFGGALSNNELIVAFDDISRQFNNEDYWRDAGMDLNDVLYAPASLKLVSDVWNESQRTVPASGYAKAANGAGNAVAYTTGSGSAATDWLNVAVKGTGIVTKTSTAGQIGERKIIEESDVANYAGTALEKISVATMGAVAAYVDTHSPTIPAPTGDCLNAANHCALVTTYANGTITYNWTVMAK